MDLSEAILTHSRWKGRLKAQIEGGEQINPETLSKDDQCDLGKWIHGEGRKHQNLPAFADLKAKHARFHTVAANVVRSARSLPRDKALAMLELKSEFGRASSDVINAITTLRTALGQ